ncbi:hypothetical protein GYH30_009513 [Glycine max]|nr:hypothetical protein GYH30_009513 [Glycine max]
MKDKYLDSVMYWDSQLMARYATLVEVSRQVCAAAYRDEEEYEKMLHFLSNEATRLKSKQNSEHCVDDNQSQQQDGDDFEDKGESKSVGNVVELATTSILAPTVLEMEMVVFHPPNKLTVMMTISFFLMFDKMQQPQTQTFIAGSSRVGP